MFTSRPNRDREQPCGCPLPHHLACGSALGDSAQRSKLAPEVSDEYKSLVAEPLIGHAAMPTQRLGHTPEYPPIVHRENGQHQHRTVVWGRCENKARSIVTLTPLRVPAQESHTNSQVHSAEMTEDELTTPDIAANASETKNLVTSTGDRTPIAI